MTRDQREGNRFLMFAIALTACLCLHAIPAKRGIWKTITLDDGTQVHAELRGDEHHHYLIDRNGNTYARNEWGTYSPFHQEDLHTTTHHPSFARPRRLNGIPTDKSLFQGKKKGIVILAQFPAGTYTENGATITDEAVAFSSDNPALLGCSTTKQLYEKIINQRHLGDEPQRGPFTGSVKDYFIDQSHGLFELDFDIAGPYTLPHCHHYYGANTGDNDSHPGEMVYDAVCLAIADGIDFAPYDWDGDNMVDQVFVLFAGQGEADGGDEDCIWPHEYYLNYSYQSIITTTANGKSITINHYACSNELATNGRYESGTDRFITNGTQIAGIGTICHEFSHCIGYPDMYDIAYENYGMGRWDLMDEGSYNGTWNGGHDDWEELHAGYQPAGYTAFEKWCAGWIEPVVLDQPQKVTDIKPLDSEGNGNAYVIYMPGSQPSIEGEYYLIENRQPQDWDTSLPWHGLLITYVHYNQALWRNNCLNCTNTATLQSRHATNTHKRLTVFQAAGTDPGFLAMDAYPYHLDYLTQVLGDTWGTTGIDIATNLNSRYAEKGLDLNLTDNDRLADDTTPQAYYWGGNSEAQPLTDHELWDIQENGDDKGSMSFTYRKLPDENILALDQDTPQPQAVATGLYSSATLNRQLSADIYNTLWLPFAMNADEVRACWGDSTHVYRLTDVTTDDEGRFVLNITDDTRNGIRPFEPFLIKTDGSVTQDTITIRHYVQVNDSISHADPIVELDNGWKMVGTKSDGFVPEGARYLHHNKHYIAGDSTTRIRAYRAYFIAPEGSDTTLAPAIHQMPVAYHVTQPTYRPTPTPTPIDTTSIESPFFTPSDPHTTPIHPKTAYIPQASPQASPYVYDLSGRPVTTPQANSIYIKDGKKRVR